MPSPALVIGAGPAGLSAAWELVKAGVPTVVLEKADTVGGLAGTFRHGDFYFDYGPHSFHPQLEEPVGLIKAMVGEDLLHQRFQSQIYFEGKLYDHPLTIRALFGLSPILMVRSFLDFMSARARQWLFREPDNTYEDWVVHRFGRTLYRRYFGSYTQKVWGISPAALAPDFASARIPESSLLEVLLRLLLDQRFRGASNAHAHSPYGRWFYYPRKGSGVLYERLAAAIVARGGRILSRTRVERVRTDYGRVVGVDIDGPGGKESLEPEVVFSTAPLPELFRLFEPSPSAGVMEAAAGLRHRALILLYLILDRERVSENHWIYFSGHDQPLNRVSEMKNFSPETCPPGQTGLVAEITCFEGDADWMASDEVVFHRTLDCLEATGLLRRDEVREYFTKRLAHGYPIYEIGYDRRLGTLFGHLDGLRNLYSFGRQGLFCYTNSDHSIHMGQQCVRGYLKGAAFKKEQVREMLSGYILSY